MRRLDVGVIGCGTAGPAAALLLARRGHHVTIYEKVAAPRPIGAGIILQPTGQAVLRALSLQGEVVARGARLDALTVERFAEPRNKPLLTLSYADVDAGYFGVGLHRGVLFEALFEAVKRQPGVTLRLGVAGEGLAKPPRGGRGTMVVDAEGQLHGPHDLIVVADGARSRFRDDTGLARTVEPYRWGALWFVAEDVERRYEGRLYQVVDGTRRMLGLLPTGSGPSTGDGAHPLVSLYWSIRADAVDDWRRSGFDEWRRLMVAMDPGCEAVVAQIRSPEDVLFSLYHDVVLSTWNTRAVVHIGDAAHATSPQLGQGANLALYDALILSDAIERGDHLTRALDDYSRRRRDHLGYYQLVTRALTPFFQSDYGALGLARDLAMPIMNRFGVFNRAMVMGMCGVADGHPWRTVEGMP